MNVISALDIRTPQGGSGRLAVSGEDYVFRYAGDAVAEAAISLLMPVRFDDYRRRELHPIFQMNLPEGYVLEQLRNRLAKRARVDPMRGRRPHRARLRARRQTGQRRRGISRR